MKTTNVLALFLACAMALPSVGQRVYNWTPANDELVRLDPGYFHAGPTYDSGVEGKNIHVDIDAQQPVTLAVTSAREWNEANERPEIVRNLKYLCIQGSVLKASYNCSLPPSQSMVLVVRDDRSEHGPFAGIGEVINNRRNHDRDRDHDRQDTNDAIKNGVVVVLAGHGGQFFAPNDVHIQYYDWSCVDKCNLPEPPHDRVFRWVPSSDETVRLDPANYYVGPTWDPNSNVRVEIEAHKPVMIGMVQKLVWNDFSTHPEMVDKVDYSCQQQHALQTTYTCSIPFGWPMFLVVRDERNLGHEEKTANQPATKSGMLVAANNLSGNFASPNDVHIQYFAWRCVEYCDQPVFQWVSQIRDKYKLTKTMKVYGGITPDHDGEQVSIRVKSPVPMAIAVLPSPIANQLYGKPDMFESSLQKSPCQQRGTQSYTFQCTFNLADGPQSLVVSPEASSEVPKNKKAEVEVQAINCVANCDKLPGR